MANDSNNLRHDPIFKIACRTQMSDGEVLTAALVAYIKQFTRHCIETIFSEITSRFPKSIHAVTIDGFLLKVATFIVAFTLEAAFIA